MALMHFKTFLKSHSIEARDKWVVNIRSTVETLAQDTGYIHNPTAK